MVAMVPAEYLCDDVNEQAEHGRDVAGNLSCALVRTVRVDTVDR